MFYILICYLLQQLDAHSDSRKHSGFSRARFNWKFNTGLFLNHYSVIRFRVTLSSSKEIDARDDTAS